MTALSSTKPWAETIEAVHEERYQDALESIPGYDLIRMDDIKIYRIIKEILTKPFHPEAFAFIQKMLSTRDEASAKFIAQIARETNPTMRAHLILAQCAKYDRSKPTSLQSKTARCFVCALISGVASAENREIDTAVIEHAAVDEQSKLLAIVSEPWPIERSRL
ncbi:MAG: hypothetical protein JSR46_10620 [Verrucomicrobia bacterium]|nr:hypothetical protein [Verrucomicrobiota bacterium]